MPRTMRGLGWPEVEMISRLKNDSGIWQTGDGSTGEEGNDPAHQVDCRLRFLIGI